MSKTDFTLNDAIGWQFDKWWDKNWPFDKSFVQAKDYASAAYRAGYKALDEIILSNSSANSLSNPSVSPTPKMQELLTRDQRDALVAANTLMASLQNGTEGLYRARLQKIMNVISDMLYE
jgi:hypothetical protein